MRVLPFEHHIIGTAARNELIKGRSVYDHKFLIHAVIAFGRKAATKITDIYQESFKQRNS